ncbi:MAG TPA: uroporphyrinogen-III synthase [Alphaproteobacteria bacterium]|jgi:uroporphyrinogen-III synthase
MRILVTRPRADAEELTKLLVARGHDVIAEPLIDVATLFGEPVATEGLQAVLFTSANGVRALVTRNGDELAALQGLPVYAVGDATARAAREAGFAQVEAASGDVNALAALVASRRSASAGPLLHVAGSHVAGDLAGLLATQGFTVTRAVLYEAKAAEFLSPETAGALRRGDVKAALFFSPRTATTFVSLAGAADLAPALGRTTAICLSPAVADAVDDLPGAASWRDILTASEPTQEALLVALDRFVERETRPTLASSPWAATEGAPSDVDPEPASINESLNESRAESPSFDSLVSDSLKPDAADPVMSESPPAMPPPIFTSSASAAPGAEDRPSWQSRVALAVVGLLVIGGLAVYLAHPAEMRQFLAFEWLTSPRSMLVPQTPPSDAPAPSPGNAGLDDIAKESDKSVAAMRQDYDLTMTSPTVTSPDSVPSTSPLADDERTAPSVPYEALSDNAVAQAPTQPAPELLARLDDLETRLSRLADRPAVAPETLQYATDAFAMRLTRLDETLSALTQKIETQSAEQGAERDRLARGQALAFSALVLRDSLDRGTPFADAMAGLQPLAQEAGLMAQADLVAPAAATGLASTDDLHNRLLALGGDMARAEAGPKDNGILARLGRSLSSVVVVRRVDDDAATLNASDPADLLLRRADRRLLAGDLAEAIAPVGLLAQRESLTPAAHASLETWLRDARARKAAEELQASLLQRGLAMRQAAPR